MLSKDADASTHESFSYKDTHQDNKGRGRAFGDDYQETNLQTNLEDSEGLILDGSAVRKSLPFTVIFWLVLFVGVLFSKCARAPPNFYILRV